MKAPGRLLALALALSAAPLSSTPVAAQPPESVVASSADLRGLFTAGRLLEDRNADTLIDYVPARLLVGAVPTEAELAAAANLAARLGYETSALDPGLLVRDDGAAVIEAPVIAIGDETAAAGALAPGQGAITILPPTPRFTAGGVRVHGYDATGLLTAAAYLAGRYPNVWRLDGETYDDVAHGVARFLTARGVDSLVLSVDALVVDANRPGVVRAVASVQVPDAESFAAAAAALELEPRDTVAREDPADTTDALAGEAGSDTAAVAGAEADSAQRSAGEGAPRTPQDLVVTDLHRLDVMLTGPDSSRTIRLTPPRAWRTAVRDPFTAREAPDFTLSDLYTIRGLYRDTDQDMVPDRTEAVVSLSGATSPEQVADLAARIGLETAGIRLPLVRVAGEDDRPQEEGLPIVIGDDHYHIERLRGEGRLHASDGGPGAGFIELVPRAFDGRPGLAIGGSDAVGVSAAIEYAAQRVPYLWTYGKGHYRLSDAENEVRRFIQARGPGGQTALAVHKLDTWLARLDGEDLDSLHVELAVERVDPGLDSLLLARVRARFPGAAATAATYSTGFGVGRTIFEEELAFPWEVDAVREALREEALPRLREVVTGGASGDRSTETAADVVAASARVRVEVRVSEPYGVRSALAHEIRDTLANAGIEDAEVVVLNAYKQGYSWLHDVILPQLRDRPVDRIEISYHTLRDSREVRWQTIAAETRWLQELYPIDAVIARELGIPDSAVTFHPTRRSDPIYTVRAVDAAGAELLAGSFTPKYVVRPFFDLFPEYEQVRVTTGWLTVASGADTLVDRRIRTDPEAFWDHLQTDTYARIIDYMMDVQDGRPSPENAPFFDEFRVELELSEPNARIGVDEEVISSLEALHEDIYFETLTLFDRIGDRYGVDGLQFAGRVLPYIMPTGEGKPGRARITFTGKERAVPELALTHRVRGEEPFRRSYPLSPLPVDPPKLRGIALRAADGGDTTLERLLLEVVAADSVDRWSEMRDRSSEAAIDRQLTSTELVAGMTEALRTVHGAGLYGETLGFDEVGEIRLRLIVDDTASSHRRLISVARPAAALSTERPVLADSDFRYDGQRLVQWQTPIPPAENDSILAKLNTFPGVNVYWIGRSFLGRDIYAGDFLPPHDATYISQAKLNAWKPTVLLSGRQHANEVSSTSHILRLGELLATDSTYRSLLDRVNVVLHPITNPDGAALAVEMQEMNPDFMLHAGYLGALGVDATAGSNSPDPIYPESKVRPELMETWLPDIYINMHGYPSHEWVQYFAGYSAWVRSRSGGQRSWWAPRGWFVPGFGWTEDDRYPEIETAQFAILDTIAQAITSMPDVEAMNRRLYARYRKYGQQDVEGFREHFHNGILVYTALRGRPASGQGASNPRINTFSVTTEAPDETARGDWLELVASAGLAHGAAVIRYLATGVSEVEEENVEYQQFVVRSEGREKPVLPGRE